MSLDSALHLISEYKGTAILVTGIVGTAFANTFPDNRPKTLDDLWDWAKEFIHLLGNARRPTNPTR